MSAASPSHNRQGHVFRDIMWENDDANEADSYFAGIGRNGEPLDCQKRMPLHVLSTCEDPDNGVVIITIAILLPSGSRREISL